MDVYVLFVQRVESNPGQYVVEALTAVTGHTLVDGTTLTMVEEEAIVDWESRFLDDLGPFTQNFSHTCWVKVKLNQTPASLRERVMSDIPVEGSVETQTAPKGNHPAYGGITVTQGRKGGVIADDEIFD